MTPRRTSIQNYLTPNPPNTVRIMRPGKWGNPFDWRKQGVDEAIRNHANWLIHGTEPITFGRRIYDPVKLRGHIHELRWKDLACTCKEGHPCHGDLLIRLANGRQGVSRDA